MQDIEKIRATAFEKLGVGDVKAAFSCISEIISTGFYTLDDLYLAGEWALDSGYYHKAIDLLTRTLSESKFHKEFWYLESALIARAYARVLIGELKLALDDLSQVNDDVTLSWLSNHQPINKISLLTKIAQMNP